MRDSDRRRELVIFKLERAGHRVIGVADGASAVIAAHDAAPDLAIVDVAMPGMSGLQVCTALRADARTARMPVILLTARARADEGTAGLEAGAVAYVTKPFSPRDLVRRVNSLLGWPAEVL
jgi:DNA-binding response OmpR family regulator